MTGGVILARMTNDVVTVRLIDLASSGPNDVDPGLRHGSVGWWGDTPLVVVPLPGDTTEEASSTTGRHEPATVGDPDPGSGPTSSVTPQGREILRSVAARGGDAQVAVPRRSRLGLDLTKFAAFVVSQPTRRPRGRGTRSLGPMPIDADLMVALQAYAERTETSKRQIVECLLHELLDHDGSTDRDRTGER